MNDTSRQISTIVPVQDLKIPLFLKGLITISILVNGLVALGLSYIALIFLIFGGLGLAPLIFGLVLECWLLIAFMKTGRYRNTIVRYFAISRAALLGLLTGFLNLSLDTNIVFMTLQTMVPVALLVLATITLITLYISTKKDIATLITFCVFAVVLSGWSIYNFNTVIDARGTGEVSGQAAELRDTETTDYIFLLESDITKNQKYNFKTLTVDDIVNDPATKAGKLSEREKSRIRNIDYMYVGPGVFNNSVYNLCATFYESKAPYENGVQITSNRPQFHSKGYQCFEFESI
jgi:hypothetical protein